MPIDATWGTLLGTVAGGAIGIIGKTLSDIIGTRKDREARKDQFRAEAEKWQREQIASGLMDSVKLLNLYITLAIGKDLVARQDDTGCREASAEAQRSLISVIMVYPHKSSQLYRDLVTGVDEAMWKAVPEIGDVWPIRQLIVKLAALIGVEGNTPNTSAVQTVPLTTALDKSAQ